ncbi:hypothetical protein ACW0JT_17290 [Arthrobacter sp. SA17]
MHVRADRNVIEASDGDLVYIQMSMEDNDGRVFAQGTEALSVVVEGEGSRGTHEFRDRLRVGRRGSAWR